MDVEQRLKRLEMQFLEVSERLTNVEELVKSSGLVYSSLGPTNYCNNAQSKSTNKISFEDLSTISKRLVKVEKQLQIKYAPPSLTSAGKENNGHFHSHSIPLSSSKKPIMGQSGKPEPLMSVLTSQGPCNNDPHALSEFQNNIVSPNGSFLKFRELLNKLNPGNFDKLTEEFLVFVGGDHNFMKVADLVFDKAINEVDSPASPYCYAQLMAKVRGSKDSKSKNLFVELRKAAMDHFSELFDVKDVSASSSGSLEDFQLSEISKRRSKGILRFIGELFKVDIVPFEDMKNFIDCLLLHPQESNLNHICLMLKWTGNVLENKSLAMENVTEFGLAANIMNSTHAQAVKWFVGVCDELERKKDFCSTRTKFAIMDVLELRDKPWALQASLTDADKYVKPHKGNSGGVWRETQQSFEHRTTSAAQQYTLFPIPSPSGSIENVDCSPLLTSPQPMAYNQVVRKSINVNMDSLELSSSLTSISSCFSPNQTREALKMQALSQLCFAGSSHSRSPSVTASLDEGASSSTRARNRRRTRPSKSSRDKPTNSETNGKILTPQTNDFSGICSPVQSLFNVGQSTEGLLLGKPMEEILNAYGSQMGTKKTQRYVWVQRRLKGGDPESNLGILKNMVGEISRAAMLWTDKKKILIAGSFFEALYVSGCIPIDMLIESFRAVVNLELKKFTGQWAGTSRAANLSTILANLGLLLAECFVKEKDLGWLLAMKPTLSEGVDNEQDELYHLISGHVKAAIVSSRGMGTYTKLYTSTTLPTRCEDSVIQNCATWNT